jgi:hypothetical protein
MKIFAGQVFEKGLYSKVKKSFYKSVIDISILELN